MKKKDKPRVAFCGSRMFMKYPDFGYFRERAENEGLELVLAKA